jgi:hypothetical protein
MIKMIALCGCNMWNTWIWTFVCLRHAWWRVVQLLNTNVLIYGYQCFKWCDWDQTFIKTRTPHGWKGRWFPHFSCMMLMFWNDLLMDDILLNPWWMMRQRWNVWLNFWWMLQRLWNVDWVLDECWNDDENVNVLKWLGWGGYIIALRSMLNQLWDVN